MMDRVPDEILQNILEYAMIEDEPFCVEMCFREAELIERKKKMDPWHYAKQLGRRSDPFKCNLPSDQLRHLLDWRAVVGTCRRIRRMGKPAFFSQKVFAMGPGLASQLQNLQVSRLSAQDQQIAVKYMSSIIWTKNRTSSPSAFLKLSRHISTFPRLRHLNLLFDCTCRQEEWRIVDATRSRRRAWPHLIDALASVGVSVGTMEVGVMKIQEDEWSKVEKELENCMYPFLRSILDIKAKIVALEI